jgi:hypothetical protein
MHRWLTPNSLGIEEFCTKLRCHRKEELQDAGAAAADGVESDEVAWGRKKKRNHVDVYFYCLYFPISTRI